MTARFEAEKKRRLAALAKDLSGAGGSDELKAFGQMFFEQAAAEDLAAYEPKSLAGFVRNAHKLFAKRRPGKPTIRIAEGPDGDVTTIDIISTNRPFILDSVLAEIQAAGAHIRLVVHPIFTVQRDRAGRLKAMGASGDSAGQVRESFVHVHVNPIRREQDRLALTERLAGLMGDIHLVTDDWREMRARLATAISAYNNNPPLSLATETMTEAVAFLQWLEDDNFTFLGMREFSYRSLGVENLADDTDGEGLGILRDPTVKVLRRGSELVTVTPEVRDFLLRPEPLIVTKANVRSRVHRRDYMDYIGVKLFDDDDNVVGELRVIGLFTSTAFTRSVLSIPFIRRKVERIIAKAGFDPESHSGKTLLNLLESYPRTELFQADPKNLLESAMAILKLHERPRVRALARRDRFDRFVSVLVYAPRDRYDSGVRERIGAMLAHAYDGRISAYYPYFPDGNLARVHFIVGRNPGDGPKPSQEDIETAIAKVVRTWKDDLRDAIVEAFDTDSAHSMVESYSAAFGSDYRANYSAVEAIKDIQVSEKLVGQQSVSVRFSRTSGMDENRLTLQFHHPETPIELSQRVPLIENLGFRAVNERTYRIQPLDSTTVYMHDMSLICDVDLDVGFEPLADRLERCVRAVWGGQAESDRFNALVLYAGLEWHEAALLRAIAGYLRQAQIPYSPDYLANALVGNPAVTGELISLFTARFDTATKGSQAGQDGADRRLRKALDKVPGLDDDTILRAFRDVIFAVQRTDFYTRDASGARPDCITLKIDPSALTFVEAPRPYREIYVHSTQVDGIHMRFGPVARGGLRWSDRPQDFRVEVLGLAKAQQTKNAVAVPVGAKGGFFPKKLPAEGGREAVFEAGRQAYITFINRLLAVTDNLDGDTIVPPANVVCHDPNDPYLVVAADKGTATFSDTANAISGRREFWLGDAFASGGSAGYDHKVMGITARGAWEAVKRHFREMDRDIQTEPFTVIGVGDMSGDVFGNGMLLSKTTRLVAAFDHRDIFIDPDPDSKSSFRERTRLFKAGRTSWQDYDRSLISKGGGVYSRQDKQVPLSTEIRNLLGLRKSTARPSEVIRAILMAEADLLWFGGIGTYVRGPGQGNADVGDKANDSIRIETGDLNVKVVGEGANLGMTQRARIAFSMAGGRCNSDAIDNSAGVNSSDMEVNIKIALASPVRSGKLKMPARNKLLKDMTDSVAELVLRNNYLQTLAISLIERRGMANLPDQARLMKMLESQDRLDRAVETLPADAEIDERTTTDKPLTRAEIGVLLAYAKLAVFDELVSSDVPDDPYLVSELMRYFPERMRSRFAGEIHDHRLRREIIATQLANSFINRCGPSILAKLRDNSGGSVPDMVRAYIIVRDSFEMQGVNADIDALDNKISGDLQLRLYQIVQDVAIDRAGWFLRQQDLSLGITALVDHNRKSLGDLRDILPGLLPDFIAGRAREVEKSLKGQKVPANLAERLAFLPTLAAATDIIEIADSCNRKLKDAAVAYYGLTERFSFGRIDAMMQSVDANEYFEQLAIEKARSYLAIALSRLTQSVLKGKKGPPDLAAWEASRGPRTSDTAEQIDAVLADGRATMAKATVAAGLMAELANR